MFRRARPGRPAREEPPQAPHDHAVHDATYRLVIAARRGGDPDEISATRADLHEAVDLACGGPAAARRLSHVRLPELDLFARAIEEHTRAAAAKPDEPTGEPPPRGR